MAREIANEEGDAAIAERSGRPGAEFVVRYTYANGYGQSAAAPTLRVETIRWAEQLSACKLEKLPPDSHRYRPVIYNRTSV